jgi:hypothetical protein
MGGLSLGMAGDGGAVARRAEFSEAAPIYGTRLKLGFPRILVTYWYTVDSNISRISFPTFHSLLSIVEHLQIAPSENAAKIGISVSVLFGNFQL